MIAAHALREVTLPIAPAATSRQNTPMNLKIFALSALALSPLPAFAQPAAPKRPNILFIFCDDHAYQAISAYNGALNQTPNIDRIAKEGMRFDRCLTTYSLCGPSRACVLTGKYSHLNGFYNNYNSKFDGSQQTMPKLLHAAGYQTALVGKWHLESDPTGFDFWEILHGQGQYYNPPMIRNGQNVKHTGYVTDIITSESLDWLKNRDKTKPFLLMCQQKAPHREWEPSLDHLKDYDGVKFPEPPTLFDDYAGRGKAEHEQDMTIAKTMNNKDLKLTPPPQLNPEQRKAWDAYYNARIEEFKKLKPTGQDLVRWKYQAYMHDYLATISSVDQSVGKILDYLKESGLEQDTIVVYSSDQGFYLGEHGWFDKRWIFEQSLRTPLLVRWPGVTKPGSTSADMVSNLDYAETFLDLAGAKIPEDMQGRSMVPILKGQTPADWRKSFYYHYYEHPAVHNVAKHYGVVTDRYKLVHFYEPAFDYWELFDLTNDPYELKSVYDDPKYADEQKKLHVELDRLRKDLKVPDQDDPKSIIPGPGANARPAPKPLNAYVLDYHFDKDQGDTVVDASGKSNNGQAKDAPLVPGHNGAKARQFNGQGYINIPKTQTLNPGVGSWTIETTFRPDKPDGILLAHGGASFGYCLTLESGKPVFTVVVGDSPTRIEADPISTGDWTTLHASYTEKEIALSMNGHSAQHASLPAPLNRNPNDNLQIGADLGSPILPNEPPPFTGLIESVKLYSGQAK
jgi:arylsulfatase A-like enzyme